MLGLFCSYSRMVFLCRNRIHVKKSDSNTAAAEACILGGLLQHQVTLSFNTAAVAATTTAAAAAFSCLTLQDTIPRGGKFVSAYKRNGQRVIINRAGDMVVSCDSIRV